MIYQPRPAPAAGTRPAPAAVSAPPPSAMQPQPPLAGPPGRRYFTSSSDAAAHTAAPGPDLHQRDMPGSQLSTELEQEAVRALQQMPAAAAGGHDAGGTGSGVGMPPGMPFGAARYCSAQPHMHPPGSTAGMAPAAVGGAVGGGLPVTSHGQVGSAAHGARHNGTGRSVAARLSDLAAAADDEVGLPSWAMRRRRFNREDEGGEEGEAAAAGRLDSGGMWDREWQLRPAAGGMPPGSGRYDDGSYDGWYRGQRGQHYEGGPPSRHYSGEGAEGMQQWGAGAASRSYPPGAYTSSATLQPIDAAYSSQQGPAGRYGAYAGYAPAGPAAVQQTDYTLDLHYPTSSTLPPPPPGRPAGYPSYRGPAPQGYDAYRDYPAPYAPAAGGHAVPRSSYDGRCRPGSVEPYRAAGSIQGHQEYEEARVRPAARAPWSAQGAGYDAAGEGPGQDSYGYRQQQQPSSGWGRRPDAAPADAAEAGLLPASAAQHGPSTAAAPLQADVRAQPEAAPPAGAPDEVAAAAAAAAQGSPEVTYQREYQQGRLVWVPSVTLSLEQYQQLQRQVQGQPQADAPAGGPGAAEGQRRAAGAAVVVQPSLSEQVAQLAAAAAMAAAAGAGLSSSPEGQPAGTQAGAKQRRGRVKALAQATSPRAPTPPVAAGHSPLPATSAAAGRMPEASAEPEAGSEGPSKQYKQPAAALEEGAAAGGRGYSLRKRRRGQQQQGAALRLDSADAEGAAALASLATGLVAGAQDTADAAGGYVPAYAWLAHASVVTP